MLGEGNEELLAYVKSPAGAKFLESAPIMLDGAPRIGLGAEDLELLAIQAGLAVRRAQSTAQAA